jgi:hypothetical protein
MQANGVLASNGGSGGCGGNPTTPSNNGGLDPSAAIGCVPNANSNGAGGNGGAKTLPPLPGASAGDNTHNGGGGGGAAGTIFIRTLGKFLELPGVVSPTETTGPINVQ